jgi:endonuclease YncB( thermonuclease family)
LALIRAYKTYLRRIPTASYLKPGFFRHRNLYGFVTRVGDGDNFHLFHTPGGRWLGWGWAPGRRVKQWKEKEVRGKTIHVRIAGVDAPEGAHFGRPAQPWSQEAVDWLRGFVLHRYVRVYPFRQDQYNRVVCAVYKRRWVVFKQDVGLQMLRKGLATVYEAKFGSEFGNKEEEYRAAEALAKEKKVGMWQEPGLVGRILGRKSSFESPREYKTRMAQQEKKADLAK